MHLAFFLSKTGKLEEHKDVKFFKKVTIWLNSITRKSIASWFTKLNLSNKTFILLLVLITYTGLTILQNSLGNTLLIIGIFSILIAIHISWSAKTLLSLIPYVLGLNLASQTVSVPFFQEMNIIASVLEIHIPTMLVTLLLIGSLVYFFNLSILRYSVILLVGVFTITIVNFAYTDVLQDYQRTRVESFLDISSEKAQAENWNRDQSLIACGSGRLFGNGFLKGTQSNYKFLPFSFTDFAYCSFTEQFGFMGALMLVSILFREESSCSHDERVHQIARGMKPSARIYGHAPDAISHAL